MQISSAEDRQQNARGNGCSDNAGNVRTHRVHQQVVVWIVFLTDVVRNPGGHRYRRDARRPYQGIDLSACQAVHDVAKKDAPGGPE